MTPNIPNKRSGSQKAVTKVIEGRNKPHMCGGKNTPAAFFISAFWVEVDIDNLAQVFKKLQTIDLPL